MATETPLPTILMCKLLKKHPTLHQRYKLKSEQVNYNEVLFNDMVEDMARIGLLCHHDNHMGIRTEQCNSLVGDRI